MASDGIADANLENELRRMILRANPTPQQSGPARGGYQDHNRAGDGLAGAYTSRGGHGRGLVQGRPGPENVNRWTNDVKPQQVHVAPNGMHRGAGHQWRGSPRGSQQTYQQPRHQQHQHYGSNNQQIHTAPIDPHSFSRSQGNQNHPRHQHPQSFTGSMRPPMHQGFDLRVHYLDEIVALTLPQVQMTADELAEKDLFRNRLENVVQKVCQEHGVPGDVTLASFGSLSSGFAKKNADMDLVLVDRSARDGTLDLDQSGGANLFETIQKHLLDQGIGARLLSKTRVPILKICEHPGDALLAALREDREKSLLIESEDTPEGTTTAGAPLDNGDEARTKQPNSDSARPNDDVPSTDLGLIGAVRTEQHGVDNVTEEDRPITGASQPGNEQKQRRSDKKWSRERAHGPLDFPKHGVGVQCDINLSNPLGIHNSHMLRCYAQCDPRVRQMVLFIKSWASARRINSSYSGTLSSYGHVLMVLHFLINIANPPVLPNLQLEAQRAGMAGTVVDGWKVQFWADEQSIVERARAGLVTRNCDTIGALLVGFFQYYAVQTRGHGFSWTQEVLSLRTMGGVLTKNAKGWTGAKTVQTDDAVSSTDSMVLASLTLSS